MQTIEPGPDIPDPAGHTVERQELDEVFPRWRNSLGGQGRTGTLRLHQPTPRRETSPPPASAADQKRLVQVDPGEDMRVLSDLLPLEPGVLVQDRARLHLSRSPAKTAQTTQQPEVVERWPFRMVVPGADPEASPWTCLRLLLHRIRTDSPLESDSVTLPQLIRALSEMEDAADLRWLAQDDLYVARDGIVAVLADSR